MTFRDNTHTLLKKWPEALVALDCNANVTVISDGARKILGENDLCYVGKHVHEAFCVETRDYSHDVSTCPLCAHLKDQENCMHSTWWKNTAGDNISLDYHVLHPQELGDVKYLISFIHNEKREYNQEELNKYAQYIDKTPSPIAELDNFGSILFANPALNECLVKHSFTPSGHPKIFPQNISELCQKCISEETNIECIEVHVDQQWYSWNLYPLRDKPATVLAWLNDITERKSIENQLIQEQTAARRDFYAKMIHELRTPINAIVGFSNLLLLGNPDKFSEEEADMLEKIYNGGLELSDLISNTLDASKIEAGKMEVELSRFSVYENLKNISDQLSSLLREKNLQFTLQCSSDITIQSDKNKFKQIITNLLSNAIKYTDAGEVSINVEEPGGQLIYIKVSDTGIGMDDQAIASLFTNYQRISGKQNLDIQGTGLGLALTRDFVTLLQGEIRVESTPGKGSCFIVILPYAIN